MKKSEKVRKQSTTTRTLVLYEYLNVYREHLDTGKLTTENEINSENVYFQQL